MTRDEARTFSVAAVVHALAYAEIVYGKAKKVPHDVRAFLLHYAGEFNQAEIVGVSQHAPGAYAFLRALTDL